MTGAKSHQDLISEGLSEYEISYSDWNLEEMIDQIIILSELKNKIQILILEMKLDLLKSYEEIKK